MTFLRNNPSGSRSLNLLVEKNFFLSRRNIRILLVILKIKILFLIIISGAFGFSTTEVKVTEVTKNKVVFEYCISLDKIKTYSEFSSISFFLALPPLGTLNINLLEYKCIPWNDISTLFTLGQKKEICFFNSLPSVKEIIRLEEPVFIRDYRVGKVTIFPVQKLGKEKIIYYFLKAEILSTAKEDTTAKYINVYKRPLIGLERVLSNLLLNYDSAALLRYKAPFSNERVSSFFLQPFLNSKNKSVWLKIPVKARGLYKIGYKELKEAGINPEKINLQTVQLFTEKGPTNIEMIGCEDGKFDKEASFVFFGVPFESIYTDTRIYWMKFEKKRSLHIAPFSFKTSSHLYSHNLNQQIVGIYWEKLHIEENRIYEEQINSRISKDDYWFWKLIKYSSPAEIIIPLESISTTYNICTLNVNLHGFSSDKHIVYFTLNDQFLSEVTWYGKCEYHFSTTIVLHDFVPKDAILHSMKYALKLKITVPQEKDEVYLNFVEAIYPRFFDTFTLNGQIEFFSNQVLEIVTHKPYIKEEKVANVKKRIFVYDVTEPFSPTMISLDSVLQYIKDEKAMHNQISAVPKNTFHKFLITTEDNIIPIIPEIYRVKDNLLSLSNQADYIIITHPEFLPAAKKLAYYRQKMSNLKVKIVNVFDIYDQFNYGIFSPKAIKDFLRYAFNYWREPLPNYVLLLGDASWDYKDNQQIGVLNYVPTHRGETQYIDTNIGCTDDWFTQISGEDMFPDLIIGRISVFRLEDAFSAVDKIIEYEKCLKRYPKAGWRNRILLVADDGFENVCKEIVREDIPQNIFKVKYFFQQDYPYIDNPKFGKGSGRKLSPQATDSFLNELKKGYFYLIYVGHGGGGVWSHERLLLAGTQVKSNDLLRMYNKNRYPFIVTLTCLTGYLDYPSKQWQSISAEELLLHKKAGAIGVLSPSGKGSTPQHRKLIKKINEALFSRDFPKTWGEVMSQGKIEYIYETKDALLSEMFIFFGDPATKLTFWNKPLIGIKSDKTEQALTNLTFPVNVCDFWSYPKMNLSLDLAISTSDIKFFKNNTEDSETIFMDIKVHNLSNLEAKDISLEIYDDDPSLGGKLCSNVAFYKNGVITLLLPNSSTTIRWRWDPPSGKSGDCKIYVLLDPQKKISETNRANNIISLPLKIKANADLIVEDIRFSKAPAFVGDTITIITKIRNIGESIAKSFFPWGTTQTYGFEIKFYKEDPDKLENEIFTMIVPPLLPNQTFTIKKNWSVEKEVNKIIIKIDWDNEVLENDKGNNIAFLNFFPS